MCYPAAFRQFRSNSTSVINKICLKNLPPRSHLSRSLEVIGTDTDPSATYDFLLTFHSNHGPISYRFRDKRRFQSKTAKNDGAAGRRKKFDDILSHLIQYTSVTDGRTDGNPMTAKTALTHSVER